MPGSPDVLDPEVIAELKRLARESSNTTFLDQLLTIFRANAPGRMARIREAIEQGDASTLENTAHTLRSNCSMLGATRMAACCADLEALGERQALAEAAALLPTAEAEFELVLAAVTAMAP